MNLTPQSQLCCLESLATLLRAFDRIEATLMRVYFVGWGEPGETLEFYHCAPHERDFTTDERVLMMDIITGFLEDDWGIKEDSCGTITLEVVEPLKIRFSFEADKMPPQQVSFTLSLICNL